MLLLIFRIFCKNCAGMDSEKHFIIQLAGLINRTTNFLSLLLYA